ncbi:MAG: U32 family peptidase [Actinomycetia bacterium]|nr:U32 family peptidase [Actinomycetes bacterium]
MEIRPIEPTKLPELLAPAGDRSALLAALAGGADAVYLGVGNFNARRNASNFSLEDLPALADLVHVSGARLYLALNTVILPEELDAARRLAQSAWLAGCDAAIVQDLGLIYRLSQDLPDFDLHASTQINLHSSEDVRLAAELGIKRATLARELSLDEIRQIGQCHVDLEVFAHGALCICYSGQCLLSSMIGGRSANRGLCAQACRLPYQLVDSTAGRHIECPGSHLLSPRDLATIEILPELVACGICSLKIEGRMKSAAYVATTVRAYRQALDNLPADTADVLAGQPVAAIPTAVPRQGHLEDLAEVFSRGFSAAYLVGERGNAMMSYQRPNNRGVQVGRVRAVGNGQVSLMLEKPLHKGDVLMIHTNRGQAKVEVEQATQPGLVSLSIPAATGPGDRIFRVENAAIKAGTGGEEAAYFSGNQGFVPVSATISLRLGQPAEICFSTVSKDGEPVIASARGSVLEAARSKPLDERAVREHVGRVGGTPFSISSWHINLSENVGMGFSELHRLRAAALDELFALLCAPWQGRTGAAERPSTAELSCSEQKPAEATKSKVSTAMPDGQKQPTVFVNAAHQQSTTSPNPAQTIQPQVAALVRDAAAGRLALQAGAAVAYVQTLDFGVDFNAKGKKRVVNTADGSRASAANADGERCPQISAYLPAITHDKETHWLKRIIRHASGAVVANNLAGIALARQIGVDFAAGPRLNLTNQQSLTALASLGAKFAWLSPELSLNQIRNLAAVSPLPLALTVFGRQELMVSEHCFLMAAKACDQHCSNCQRRQASHQLLDRKGYNFPVFADQFGRGHLFNAVPLDLVPSLPDLAGLGIATFVVDTTLLRDRELQEEVARAAQALQLVLHDVKVGKSTKVLSKREGFTTGHIYRGVQ